LNDAEGGIALISPSSDLFPSRILALNYSLGCYKDSAASLAINGSYDYRTGGTHDVPADFKKAIKARATDPAGPTATSSGR
jgi:hypothetical protein